MPDHPTTGPMTEDDPLMRGWRDGWAGRDPQETGAEYMDWYERGKRNRADYDKQCDKPFTIADLESLR